MSSRTRSRVRPSIAVAKERISAVYRPESSPEKAVGDTRNWDAIRSRDFYSDLEERERERKLRMKRRHSSVHSAPDKENREPLLMVEPLLPRRRFDRSIGARGSVSSSKMDSASSSRSSMSADSRKSSSVGPLVAAAAPAAVKPKRKASGRNGHTLTIPGNVVGPYTQIPEELRRQVEQDAIDFPEPAPVAKSPLKLELKPQLKPELKLELKLEPKLELVDAKPPAPGGSPLDAPMCGWRLVKRTLLRLLTHAHPRESVEFVRVLKQQHRVEEKWCKEGDTWQQKLFNENYERLKQIVASLTGGKTALSFPQVEETAVSVMRACHFCGTKAARRLRFCTNCKKRYRL
ncbi:hypothetical protein M3Y99_01340000 [Aphelenchoides fujianensis]|nr:hypothetical protein M3Y99_01340000 [Aphelenchoides fujianensis]